MTCNYISRIRQKHPRAYERWSGAENKQLIDLAKNGMSLEDIAQTLGRQRSAIISRMRKLEIEPQNATPISETVDASFVCQWVPVESSPGESYKFPEQITQYMRQKYRKAAVYRWKVMRPHYDDKPRFYIGESQRLCPERINGYLEPKPSQDTNKRVNRFFTECLASGHIVFLDILTLKGSFLNDMTFTDEDIERQDVRRLIERLLVALYRHHGVQLMNL